ncbi:alpha-L-fucosidase [Maribellus comscasis]|uniref:alpha-L-fucosidase n=1 Tax=Maribellus comscasis TaxID=2681766 RepID=A0A6I6JKT0_9BACT|nr:alpha-L-fucosidase [Maribellus comscasis]QGY43455.1 alpha-L-fucosidase [Maribellus comscasis]
MRLKKSFIVFLISQTFIFSAISQKVYEPTWESLDKHKMPQWYDDAKIGLSMHWGVYSVPAWAPRQEGISYAEWYGSRMNDKKNPTYDYHREVYGNDVTYDDFIPQWKAELYNPDDWAKFAKKMGAKYMFITSKHHDGFCLWPSKYTNRNAKKMGPEKDILGEYFKAARNEGLKVGLYYSLYEWYNPIYTGKEIPYAGLKRVNNYVDDFMIPQIKELIDLYHPDFFYFDGEWDHPEPFWKMKEVVAYYYNEAAKRNQEVFVNDRFGKGERGKHGDLYNVEYDFDKGSEGSLTHKWSFWQGIAKTFGYNQDTDPEDCLTPKQFIDKVIKGVSQNGNFDINVGPTAEGEIPEYEQYPLLGLGEWLLVNGEAIYGTHYWKVQEEGDICYTAKDQHVYAIFLKWQGETFNLKSVKPVEGSKITMLGVPGELKWDWTEDNGLTIYYPKQKSRPTSCSYAWAFKIKVS